MKDIWVSVSGAIAQQRNVDTIANNVANANTPGYKKDKLAFREYLTALSKGVDSVDLPHKEWSPEDFYRSYGAEKSFVKVSGRFTDFTQGQLTPTGNPLDLALSGKGFFEILTPSGVRYTRRGIFNLNKQGQVVDEKGNFLLSKLAVENLAGTEGTTVPQPEERKVTLPPGKFTINLQGEIFGQTGKIADLSIVNFKDPHALEKEGSAAFINKNQENLLLAGKLPNVHQGFIEESNVNPIAEMSSLIKANRHFETIQRAIKAYDNITGKGVNEISKF